MATQVLDKVDTEIDDDYEPIINPSADKVPTYICGSTCTLIDYHDGNLVVIRADD